MPKPIHRSHCALAHCMKHAHKTDTRPIKKTEDIIILIKLRLQLKKLQNMKKLNVCGTH